MDIGSKIIVRGNIYKLCAGEDCEKCSFYETKDCGEMGCSDGHYEIDHTPITTDWGQVRIQAAIAAMPIANNIIDNLYCADYHGTEVSKLHSIERFTQECVAIADALVEELKKEK